MTSNGIKDDFVTIVPVGETRANSNDSAFVTVLSVGSAEGAAKITVNRPKGARLGLGLKFEGGSIPTENVRRLLVQSCAEGSPAAGAKTPWGNLIPGDEILAIDNVAVIELTRIDCVRRLKETDEVLTLMVRHFEDGLNNGLDSTDSNTFIVSEDQTLSPMPPPVPPRKLNKRNSFKSLQGDFNKNGNHDTNNDETAKTQAIRNIKLFRKSSFDSHLHRQTKEVLKRSSPEEVRRLVRRLSDGKAMPPKAEHYMDLLSEEWEKCLALADAESDDTGSSICTVVDRLSSIASSVENSIPSTPIMQHKMLDLKRVLSCIENMDADLLSDALLDANKNNVEKRMNDKFENGKPFDVHSKMTKKISEKVESVSDRNNNTTTRNVTCISIDTGNSTPAINTKCDPVLVKPKPMPRSVRPENVVIVKESLKIDTGKQDVVSSPVIENLLTPTKKNCIENWLQRSEEELKDASLEKYEADVSSDALPRLIDFVPKPHFIVPEEKVQEVNNKNITVDENISETPKQFTLVITETAREDGSGASLDTIGEDDEGADTSNTEESADSGKFIEDKKRSFTSQYWNGNGNRSDIEDKSLSNDETLPSCPRQPPDGVETPNDVIEKMPDVVHNIKTETRPMRATITPGWTNSAPRPRLSYSRNQDERSECSVRDKIAMFSSAASTDQVDKCGLINNTAIYTTHMEKRETKSLNRRFTKSHENLLDDRIKLGNSFSTFEKRPPVLCGGEKLIYNTSRETIATINDKKPLFQFKDFYSSTNSLKASTETTTTTSRSRLDTKDKKSHKATLEYLIEQRKKSMSKLRGLVLPESQNSIPDLPEIKVKEERIALSLFMSPKNPTPKLSRKQLNVKETLKNHLLPNSIPKYSPAFKRKSLQLCSSKESDSRQSKINNNEHSMSTLRGGLMIGKDYETAVLSDKRAIHKIYNDSMDVKICTATEVIDSDNDSAVSSTQSSYRSSASSPLHTIDSLESDSSHLSPSSSQFVTYASKMDSSPFSILRSKISPESDKIKVSRSMSTDTNASSISSSAGSAATSGSQASCSSLESSINDKGKRRVVRTHSIDSINRRNILASAKCRSGRDLKVNSPVIESKFTHESKRSPSPEKRSSERLSTLTSSVSAPTNKGESRRIRTKIIADSDSDSEIDNDLRQRKPDYKATRARKSVNNKNEVPNKKTIEDILKVDETPGIISERIMKEMKQAGLGNTSFTKKISNDTEKPKDLISKETKQLFSTKKGMECKFNSNNEIQSKTNNLDETAIVSSSEEANTTGKVDSIKICLKRGNGAGVGLILAGGSDCEAKNVTIHKVLVGSAADREGLKRGSRIISINGKNMEGLTHAETVAVLKEPRPEVAIEIATDKTTSHSESCSDLGDSIDSSLNSNISASKLDDNMMTIILTKAGNGAGLGFGLDGGKDSPHGDKPLTIKKLFAGGAAAKSGKIHVGAELVSAGDINMQGLTRTQAWARLKDLPVGPVTLVLRNTKV